MLNELSWPAALATLAAYLLGSLSFAVIVSRIMGLRDPRQYGSGNPGATNVLRGGSKAAAAGTLLLDAFKGWLPAYLALHHWPSSWGGSPATVAALVGLAAFLGHLYPVFFRFAGGKGVATAAGVLLAFAPAYGLLVLAVWLLVVAIWRYSSLAALLAALASPLIYGLWPLGWWTVHPAIWLTSGIMSVLLVWRHRQNIQRLLAGQESKLGRKA